MIERPSPPGPLRKKRWRGDLLYLIGALSQSMTSAAACPDVVSGTGERPRRRRVVAARHGGQPACPVHHSGGFELIEGAEGEGRGADPSAGAAHPEVRRRRKLAHGDRLIGPRDRQSRLLAAGDGEQADGRHAEQADAVGEHLQPGQRRHDRRLDEVVGIGESPLVGAQGAPRGDVLGDVEGRREERQGDHQSLAALEPRRLVERPPASQDRAGGDRRTRRSARRRRAASPAPRRDRCRSRRSSRRARSSEPENCVPTWKSEHGAVRDVSTKPASVISKPTTMTGHEPSPRRGRASRGGRVGFASACSGSTGADALSSVSTRMRTIVARRCPTLPRFLVHCVPRPRLRAARTGRPSCAQAHAGRPSVDRRPLDAGRRCRSAVRAATSSASGSWKSRSSGIPAVRRTALSRTLFAGRGAGRGGSSSAVVIGRTIAGSSSGGVGDVLGELEPRHGTLVGDVMDAAAPFGARRRSIGARSAVNVGQPRWSSTKARRPGVSSPSARRRRIVRTMLRSVLAAHPRRAHHGRRRAEDERLRSPASFDAP